jgi:hypothetical protein
MRDLEIVKKRCQRREIKISPFVKKARWMRRQQRTIGMSGLLLMI